MVQVRDINGVGVGVAAAGVVVAWAGIRNVTLVEAFKDLAMGKAPTPHPKPPWADVAFELGEAAADLGLGLAAGGLILAEAERVMQSPAGRANYCWGGGHSGSPCSARCFDCSGFVSCVLNKLGLMKGSMTTLGFLAWGGATTVPYGQRQPGDLLVSRGHMGIAIDDTRMINAACTKCGPVKISNYAGRRGYSVRRVKLAGRSGGSGGAQSPRGAPLPAAPLRRTPIPGGSI